MSGRMQSVWLPHVLLTIWPLAASPSDQVVHTLITLIPVAVGLAFALMMTLFPRWFGFWMSNQAADRQRARDIAAAAEAQAREHKARIVELLLTAASAAPPGETLQAVESLASKLAVSTLNPPLDQSDSSVTRLIEDYHRQALTQASWQFVLSAAAAVIGLLVIVAELALTTTSSTADALVRSFPGIVTEAIAVLFFSQARDTRRRATDLFDRLRSDNVHRQALAVANAIDDPSLRDETRSRIAVAMAGLRLPHHTLVNGSETQHYYGRTVAAESHNKPGAT